MQQNDIIEPSISPWALPIVLVWKKYGSARFCVDYRRLNNITKKNSYLLPRNDDTLDTLSGHQWFSTLDLKSDYWNIEMHSDDRKMTVFTTGRNFSQFKVMSFSLSNAPATFERLMEKVLRGFSCEACLVYLDDIIIVLKNICINKIIFNMFKFASFSRLTIYGTIHRALALIQFKWNHIYLAAYYIYYFLL